MGTVPFREGPDGIFDFLNEARWNHIGLYVVENYRIRPASVTGGWQHQWDEGEALQVIGAVKCVATAKGALVVRQEPTVLPAIAKKIGYPYNPKKHINDEHSATLHGAHYLWEQEGPDASIAVERSSGEGDSSGVRRPARVTQISSFKGLRKAGNKRGVELPK